jgi:hypothetical protein
MILVPWATAINLTLAEIHTSGQGPFYGVPHNKSVELILALLYARSYLALNPNVSESLRAEIHSG